MEKAGAGPAYYAEPSAPPFLPATGIPVVTSYYPPQPEAPAGFHLQGGRQQRRRWSSRLCHCCDDVDNCCITCWCPCITFGRIAEIVDRGNTSCGTSGALYALLCSLTGFHFIYSCTYRTKLRSQYSLPGSSCTDCMLHCCCEPCSLCQQHRELRSRGYDMEIGWQGNMDMWARNQTVPPTAPAGMIK